MKKYENKHADCKVNKENGATTRNLCFHDWLIVRELKILDDTYDEMLRQVNYRVLDLCDIEDSDNRQEKYNKLLEERETLRAIYIQRRNELKAGFTDRQDRKASEKEMSDNGWRKSRIERLNAKDTKAALNKKDGIICDDLVDGLEDYVNMDSWHKYTPEELEERGIVKGTLAKGRLHPDDVGKELTPEMLNRVIWESEMEGVNNGSES